jgi:hypothetical protein
MDLSRIRAGLDRRLAVLLLSLSLIGTGIASLALLADTLTVTNEHTGVTLTIDLQANGAQSISTSFAWTDVGQSQAQALTISNDGNAELRYALRSTLTGTGSLSVPGTVFGDIYRLDGIFSDPPCTPTTHDDGVEVTRVSEFIFTSLDTVQFGNPATGQQSGDRLLAAGAQEKLCLVMSTAAAPDGDAQHVMTFSAESTAP